MNKVKRIKNDNYTVVSNVFLRDKNLSLKSKGLLTTIMALPDDWDFSIKGISKVLKEGASAIYSAIEELKDNGYCVVVKERDDKGLFVGNDYTFFEEPHLEEPHQDYPHSENRDMDNQAQINKQENIGRKKQKKERNEYAEDFEKAYALYRRKGSKAEAYVEWKKLGDEEKERVFKHIPYYVSVKELCYQKDFVRYLKNNLFMDVVYDKSTVVFDPNAPISLFPEEKNETIELNGVKYR